VRIAVLTPLLNPQGGMELAASRLASVLVQAGHEVSILYGEGEAPPDIGAVRVPVLVEQEEPIQARRRELESALGVAGADLLIGFGNASWLLAEASAKGPTIWSMQGLAPVCPDGSKYWSRVSRPCRVRAGSKCRIIRPVLGCTDLATALRPGPVSRLRAFERLFNEPHIGFLAPSSDMRNRLLDQGAPEDRVRVLPNLGICSTAAELETSADAWPTEDRDAVIFLGRLSETKGAHLLPRLARRLEASGVRLVAYGWGYLQRRLEEAVPGMVKPPVSQEQVAGGLLWARGVLAPGLWPEPGGLVAIDAQLAGAPLGSFAHGAALDWAGADLHRIGDVDGLASWASALRPLDAPRDAEVAARRQAMYRTSVGSHAASSVEEFQHTGRWEDPAADAFKKFLGASIAL
jgi:glycosyltransferase involved in cell wall biosynthesis